MASLVLTLNQALCPVPHRREEWFAGVSCQLLQCRRCTGAIFARLINWTGAEISFRGFVNLHAVSGAVAMSGITGLCRHRGAIYAGLQTTPSSLCVFEEAAAPKTVALKAVHKLHSMVSHGEAMLLVSTGTDSVIAFYPEALQECRSANVSFYEDVLAILKSTATIPA
jgi:hypothetical protein